MRFVSLHVACVVALAVALQITCSPSLDGATDPASELDLDGGAGGTGGASGGLAITIEPPAPLAAAPPILRLHVSLPGWTFDPGRMSLVSGVVTTRELSEFSEDKLSTTLGERVIESIAWSEGEGAALAPTEILTLGATYSLVMADIPATVPITIMSADATPALARVWPPSGGSGTASLAIWCGATSTAGIDDVVATAPRGSLGHLRSRVVDGGAGAACLRFDAIDAEDSSPAPMAVLPPFVAQAGRLDPRPIQVDEDVLEPTAALCKPGEIRFGPGCATVLDDRILARSPPVAALWAIAAPGVDLVIPAAANDPFIVSGLTPSNAYTLDVVALDAAGRTSRTSFTTTTGAPQAHLAINEVDAWPLGASPGQEWVEIVNDGLAEAVLDGFVLLVGDQPTPLPSATLAPGAFALVVSTAFVASDGVDPPPAVGTALWTVPHLGHDGLSKEGETFTLTDGSGATVSTFPATPKPKQGDSVARTTPSAPDGAASSFGLATPTPGAPNRLSP